MNERRTLNEEEKAFFFNLSKENRKSFLLFDQVLRKYDLDFENDQQLLLICFFQLQKIKHFFLILKKLKKYVINYIF